jgi:acetyl-CoA carboxylase biotin carboxyl carrier protein
MSLSFDPAALRALADLLNATGLSEIELEEGGRKLRLARVIAPVNMPVMAQPMMQAAPIAAAAPPPAGAEKPDPARHPGAVKSPMVGVAYLSAEPGAAAYVSVGQTVEAGQTLLLIEAMKTFNQIKAPKAGVVKQVLVTAGAPVEYDEPLMIIE